MAAKKSTSTKTVNSGTTPAKGRGRKPKVGSAIAVVGLESEGELNGSEQEVTALQLIPEYLPEDTNKRFNRRRIAEAIAHTEGLTIAQSERIVQLVIDTTILAVCAGYSVYLPNLGKLEASYMPPRSGRHPRTHEPMTVEAGLRLKFAAATPVNRKLNEGSDRLKEALRDKHEAKQLAAANKKRLLLEQQQQQALLASAEEEYEDDDEVGTTATTINVTPVESLI